MEGRLTLPFTYSLYPTTETEREDARPILAVSRGGGKKGKRRRKKEARDHFQHPLSTTPPKKKRKAQKKERKLVTGIARVVRNDVIGSRSRGRRNQKGKSQERHPLFHD